ncbi:MAG: hypothetical protein ACRD6W_13845 [Nitrososphaerales archaeon]
MDRSFRRGATHLFHALGIGIAAFLISAALVEAAYAAVPTTRSVLKAAKVAIGKEPGVHIVSLASSGSSILERISADVGTTSGTETVSEGKATLAVELTPTYAYIRGNSSGLTSLFGLSTADAKKVGTHWESFKAGTSQYSSLKPAVTTSSVTALFPSAKGTKLSTHVMNGAKLYVLKWTTAATSSLPELSNTFTFSTAGTALPVKETSTASGAQKVMTTFSAWGEQVRVRVPPRASTIASSKIRG